MKKIIMTVVTLMIFCIATTVFAEVETLTGKITKIDNQFNYGIFQEYINGTYSMEYDFSLDDLKNTTKEFRQCIDNGKYKGNVEITTEILHHIRSLGLALDRSSTCKRK